MSYLIYRNEVFLVAFIQNQYIYRNKDNQIIWGGPVSNSWYYDLEYNGVTFVSAYHAITYCKARALGNDTLAKEVLSARRYEAHLAISKQLDSLPQDNWTKVEQETVRAILRAKFSNPIILKELLVIKGNFITSFIDDPYSVDCKYYKNGLELEGLVERDLMGNWLKEIININR